METSTKRTKPLTDIDEVSCLDTFDGIEITGEKLRPGMMILDELDTVAVILDHKVRATRNSGCVAFLCENIDPAIRHLPVHGGIFSRHEFHRNRTYRVATARQEI